MSKINVRIEGISIQGLKNVLNGSIVFKNPRTPFRANVLGLYGQNGSGKTALIDAVELLRLALCGEQIPSKFADFINVDAPYARLKYQLNMKNEDEAYDVVYEFCIKKDTAAVSTNAYPEERKSGEYRVVLFDEVLSYAFAAGAAKCRMSRLIDTRTQGVFLPRAKYECLIGTDDKIETELLVAKKIASVTSRSFVFSRELLQIIRSRREDADEERRRHRFVLERLVSFGNFELFVINTTNSGLISMDALPLSFKYEEGDSGAVGSLMVPLDNASVYLEKELKIIKKIINSMNGVLSQIIPELTIDVRELGNMILQDGKIGVQIQLVSCRDGKEIALRYESEGIKKIISVLHLLINVYNRESLTVAIDEFDAGIFEYLLGEILRVVSEKGKGQLIFTSHNLRPLETLDRGYIAFTTTNPSRRYIRMTNVKGNNNLRDFYYRDIVLGEQSEPVYEPTSNYEIALAFREAGDLGGA